VRRWLFFWEGVPRPVAADESLAALLARRDAVRARQSGPVAETGAELFEPRQPVAEAIPLGADGSALPETKRAEAAPPPAPAEADSASAEPSGTTSRLLAAKRRAQRKME
jgi:hypothetical protein